jgi:hypothetical protein
VVNTDYKKLLTNSPIYLAYENEMIRRILEERKNCLYYNYQSASPREDGGVQLQFHKDQTRFKILQGSPRSSKTVTAEHEILWYMTGEHPFIDMPVPNYGWYIVPSFKKIEETGGYWQRMKEHAPAERFEFVHTSKNIYKVIDKVTGSEFTYKSIENKLEDFGGVEIDWYMFDERSHNPQIREQLRMRVATTEGRGIFTMDRFETDEWVNEWINSKDDNGNQLANKYVLTAADNKFISESERNRLMKEMDEIEQLRNLHGIATEVGVTYLFPDTLWNNDNYTPINPTRFDIDFRLDKLLYAEEGLLRVFIDKQDNIKYTIIVDSAEGLGHDESVFTIFDQHGEQVAVWHDNMTPVKEQAVIIKFLSDYYNKAIVVPEAKGFSGGGIMSRLEELRVPRFYEPDKMMTDSGKTRMPSPRDFGVMVNGRKGTEKKLELANLAVEMLKSGSLKIHYWLTKEQLSNYGINAAGKVQGLRLTKWHDNLGRGEKEANGKRIGHDDHSTTIIFGAYALKKLGWLRADYSKYIYERKIDKPKGEEFTLWTPSGIKRRGYGHIK